MLVTTKAQRVAVKRVYDRKCKGEPASYLAFRRKFKQSGVAGDNYLFGPWCGMWLGIEKDGYTHS